MGGLSPAKNAPSVGFVYFYIPHETQRLAQTTKAAREAGARAPRGQLFLAFTTCHSKLVLTSYSQVARHHLPDSCFLFIWLSMSMDNAALLLYSEMAFITVVFAPIAQFECTSTLTSTKVD